MEAGGPDSGELLTEQQLRRREAGLEGSCRQSSGTCQPKPVRRVEIPTLLDRLLQQALLQILDRTDSGSSCEVRPRLVLRRRIVARLAIRLGWQVG